MELTKEDAKKLYPSATDWFKVKLDKAFGKESFRKLDWKDIKTFEDACTALDIDPDAVCCDVDTSDEVAYKMLKVIIQAINQEWTPDWSNTSQRKWYPWFNLSSGFGFDGSCYVCGNSCTAVGSRLCFESEEKSNHAGQQFLEIYRQFMTISK